MTITATLEGSEANCVNKLAVNMKKGAPGGWPTSNLYAEEINSPQSQKLAVGHCHQINGRSDQKNDPPQHVVD